jgi:hypothetical protein
VSAGSLTAATVVIDPCAHGNRCVVKDAGRVPRLLNSAVTASRAAGSIGSPAGGGTDPRLHPVRADTLSRPWLSRRTDSRTPGAGSASKGRNPDTSAPRRTSYRRDNASAMAVATSSSSPGRVYRSALALKMPPRRTALILQSVARTAPLTATATDGPAAVTASATALVIGATTSRTRG